MILNDRTLAWTGLGGTLCDAAGGIYLTYELLGGARGPLGLLNRALTYSILYGLAYGAVFGAWTGAVIGVGLGSLLAYDYWNLARHQSLYGSSPLRTPAASGALRGVVFGLATWSLFGKDFAVFFGALGALGLLGLYKAGYGLSSATLTSPGFKVRPQALKSSVVRGVVIGLAGAAAGILSTGNPHDVGFGLAVGATVGAISAVMSVLSPFIESRLENLPDRGLATFGFLLILAGLVLQSVQYLSVLTAP